VCWIVNGTRPTKPEDAVAIGLSDPLWELLQACWSGDRSRRPQMQYVEVQVGTAAARWETQTPSRRSVPLSRRHRDSLSNLSISPPSPSSTGGMRHSSASDPPRANIPEIRIDVVGPEENDPYPMQEFYPIPSPISPSQAGGQSNEALINRLDRVSPPTLRFGYDLNVGFSF